MLTLRVSSVFFWRIENGNIIIGARNNVISAEEKKMGEFLLVYNGYYTPLKCLSIYIDRDSMEKAFCTLNTDLDMVPSGRRRNPLFRVHIIVCPFHNYKKCPH